MIHKDLCQDLYCHAIVSANAIISAIVSEKNTQGAYYLVLLTERVLQQFCSP